MQLRRTGLAGSAWGGDATGMGASGWAAQADGEVGGTQVGRLRWWTTWEGRCGGQAGWQVVR